VDEEEARVAAERICQERFSGVAALVTAFHTEEEGVASSRRALSGIREIPGKFFLTRRR
jgi:hypothetical protein